MAKKKSRSKKRKASKSKKKRSAVKKRSRPKKVVRRKAAKKTKRSRASKPKRAAVKRPKVSKTSGSATVPQLELEGYKPQIKEEPGIPDVVKGSTVFSWVGVGQCGGRLAKSFYDIGYRKIIALNTTHHDLDLLEIPKNQKILMDIGEKGAGKDMERGRDAGMRYQQELLHNAKKIFGTKINHVMVCLGAGGGTGGGSAAPMVDGAKKYARHMGITEPDKHVGAFLTLPTVGEASSPTVAKNAYRIATELCQMASRGQLSPLIIIDNEKISKMYPGLTVNSFWPTINSTVAGLFDIFNRLSALSSQYTSFDPVDYHSILRAGGCSIMGITKVDEYKDGYAISNAVRNNLEKTLLAGGFDLSTAKVVGCIAVGGKKLMKNVKGLQDNLNYAFDVLTEITGNATVHRGIYDDTRESLRVYTIIGGLDAPRGRLNELKK